MNLPQHIIVFALICSFGLPSCSTKSVETKVSHSAQSEILAMKMPVADRFPAEATFLKLRLKSAIQAELENALRSEHNRQTLESVKYYLDYEFSGDCKLVTALGDTLSPSYYQHENPIVNTGWEQVLLAFEARSEQSSELIISSDLYEKHIIRDL